MEKSKTVVGDPGNKEERKIETGKLYEGIASKIVEEVEEAKSSPTSNVESNYFKLKKVLNPLQKRCVVIVPPLYLDQDVQSKLIAKNEGRSLEYEWQEASNLSEDCFIILCKSIKIKDRLLVGATTFFLFAGFDEENKIATLKKLEKVAETNDKSQYRKQENTFVVSREKQKTLDILWSNMKTFTENLAKELPNNYLELNLSKPEDIVDKVDFVPEKLRVIQSALTAEQLDAIRETIKKARGGTKQTNTNRALFFTPVGMPGMGKTTFLNNLKNRLEEKGCTVTVISTDRIRKQKIDEAMKEDSDLTEDDAFENVGMESYSQYLKEISAAIQKTDSLSQSTHIILLDKNHVPKLVRSSLEKIMLQRSRLKSKCAVKNVLINPLRAAGFRTQTGTFPFSLTFFLTCLHRALGRKDHETLKGSNILAVQVILRFFKEYKDFITTEDNMKALKVHFVLEIPFTNEDGEADQKLPETLVKSFIALLNTVEEPEEEKIIAFLDEFEKSKFEPKILDTNMIAEEVVDGLNKQFSLF